jgi:hypothetical protein
MGTLVSTPVWSGSSASPRVTGAWGGDHITLVVTEEGGRAEFDCALGTIAEPLRQDEGGNFQVRGTYALETGGPGQTGDVAIPRPEEALYRGWTDGQWMRLTVILPAGERQIGHFSLVRGRRAVLEKCL